MPLELKCAKCNEIIPVEEDYFNVMIGCKEFDGQTIINDTKDQQYDDYCEKCLSEDTGIAGELYKILNKRTPNPSLKKDKS